ncbi:uncharacterized protein N7500_001694 [Penicillium coprophilum]|uniref:uncharacterized protein n=1 Tax=Penicillium coprophilum TaxID=36646 RepID=UPI002394407F|nr:uncharacterized protein N7500_001694 [Penicillium coprophilum]KAJ5173763.1 hypothetical protein N7500_001694 [Penicillium coprophilum]
MTRCGHLCASSKRMRRHWSDVHGISGSNDFASHARSVNLQTFFRGTKLKYFEVSVESRAPGSQSLDEGAGCNRMEPAVHDVPSQAQSMSLSGSSPVVDLETLTYFHHFTTTTCLTLPKIDDSLPASKYWGTYIVSLALQQHWLMCGLLAVSAYHSATLDGEKTAQEKHYGRATNLRSEFGVGFKKIMSNTLNNFPTETFQKTRTVAIQVRSIMSCARWLPTGLAANQEVVLDSTTGLSQLQYLLCDIRDFASSELGKSLEIEQSMGDDPQTSFGTNSLQVTVTALAVLLNRLQMLPYRMAEIFGKPDHEQDAPAILLSIGALIRCCSSICNCNDLPRAWQSISTWLNKTTNHFNHMISLHHTAALIVLAHWAAILVKWTEVYECWLIQGFSRTIVLLISEHLSMHDGARGLVEGLLE